MLVRYTTPGGEQNAIRLDHIVEVFGITDLDRQMEKVPEEAKSRMLRKDSNYAIYIRETPAEIITQQSKDVEAIVKAIDFLGADLCRALGDIYRALPE